jgi:hypothetical protein
MAKKNLKEVVAMSEVVRVWVGAKRIGPYRVLKPYLGFENPIWGFTTPTSRELFTVCIWSISG